MNADIRVVTDGAALAQAAAALIVAAVAQQASRFSLVLSGGSTPNAVYQLLAQPPVRASLPWERIHLFWGDERYVPADHPESNFRMAREALIDHVPIPASNVHRINTDLPADEAAAVYQQELHRFFTEQGSDIPQFDLVLLGLGEDGHTASLFPNTAALEEAERWVVANDVPQLSTTRLTLTFPVINQAKQVAFLVGGEAKAAMVAQVLGNQHEGAPLPSQRVQPGSGQLIWLLDQGAASLLRDQGEV